MRNKRFLLLTFLTLSCLFLFSQSLLADPGNPDTVRVATVQVDPDPVNPVVFSVPVTLYNDEILVAGSLGLFYNSTDVTIDSVQGVGTRTEYTGYAHSARPADQLAVVGWTYVPFLPNPPFHPLEAGDGVIANLWFTLAAGAPDQTIAIDSGYYPPAGYFTLSDENATAIAPEYNAGSIIVGTGGAASELSLNPDSLGYEAVVGGGDPATQSFLVENIGTGDMDWVANESADWFNLDFYSGTASSGSPSNVNVNVTPGAASLPAGFYEDFVTITADGATGSPAQVKITLDLTAAPEISVSVAELNFQSVEGAKEILTDQFDISNTGGGTLDWSLSKLLSQTWLGLDPTSGTDAGTVDVTVTTDGLTAGTYEDTIVVSATGASNTPVKIPVNLEILAGPEITLSEASILVNAVDDGPNPADYDLYITNTGGGTLNWSATNAEAWMIPDLTSGALANAESDTVTISFDISSLNAGTFYDTLVVTDAAASNSPQKFAVELVISEATPSIAVDPAQFSVSTPLGQDAANETLNVSNAGGGTLNFDVSNLRPWLSLNPASGTADQAITLQFDTDALASGTYYDTITVTSAEADNSPVEVEVELTVLEEDPVIVVSPVEFFFTIEEGFAEVDTLSVSNGGGGSFAWSVGNAESWLTLAPTSGSGDAEVELNISAAGLAAGMYYDTINVGAIGAINTPVKVPVELEVTSSPQFDITDGGLEVDSLVFGITLGDPVEIKTIDIGSSGSPINWEETHTSSWLLVDPHSGTTPSSITVSVDTIGLGEGDYKDTIKIVRVLDKSTDMVEVPIVLSVVAPQPEFTVNPDNFQFTTDEGVNPPAQSLDIGSTGNALSWTATVSEPWLIVSSSGGTTPSTIDVSVDVVGQSLAPNTYNATIEISDAGKAATTVVIPVELVVNEVVQPILAVNPTSMNFAATQGGLNPDVQVLSITNDNGGTLEWTANYDAGWLSLSQNSGTDDTDVDVIVDIAGLIPDTYNETLEISAIGALNSPQTVNIELVVSEASSQGGDTVWVSDEVVTLGDVAEVEITFKNDNTITGIGIPIEYNPLLVTCDSVSFAGSRVEYLANLESTINEANGTVNLGAFVFDEDLIPVGEGLFAKLYFSTLDIGTTDIDTTFIEPASWYLFADENALPFYPKFYKGSIEINEVVAPMIGVSDTEFNFTGVFGGGDPANQYLTVTNTGAGVLSWSATNFESWLGINPTSGGDGDVIELSVSLNGLAVGTYKDSIEITDPSASNSPVYVIVNLTVEEAGPPTDTVRVETVYVTASDTNPVEFMVPVSLYNMEVLVAGSLGLYYNSDDITIDSVVAAGTRTEFTGAAHSARPGDKLAVVGWTYVPFLPNPPYHPLEIGDGVIAKLWFTLAAGAPEQIIDIDSGYYPPAGYWTLSDEGANAISPAYVKGYIHVESEGGVPVLAVSHDSLYYEGDEGGPAPADQSIDITNAGEGDLNWIADWDAAWLSVTPSSGTNDVTVDVAVDPTGLTPGTYTETITVSAAGADNSPQMVKVVYKVNEVISEGLSGTVVDKDSQLPLEGATVDVYDMYPSSQVGSTTTDVDGFFEFPLLGSGHYYIRVTKDGYYPALVEHDVAKAELVIELKAYDSPYPTNEFVLAYCDMNYFEGELIQVGDVVEAYDSAQNVLCGQWIVSEVGSYGFMPIYRDDETTVEKDGCLPGEKIVFKINGYVDPAVSDVRWTEFGDELQVCLDVSIIKTVCIDLEAGWNLISWNVLTETTDLETIIADIINDVDVILGFESGALTYDPDLTEFSTLFDLDHFHGYWFRMDNPATLCVSGMALDPSTPIALEMGWNLVSYLPDEEQAIEDALASIMDEVIIVLGYDGTGLTYDPDNVGASNLLTMAPEYGYWIKVASEVMLTYPGGTMPGFAKIAPDSHSDNIYTGVNPTNSWVNLYGSRLRVDNQLIEPGTVLEAVNAEGNVIGSCTVVEYGKFGFMPVYGGSNGLSSGDEFYLTVNGQETEEGFTFTIHGDRISIDDLTLKSGSPVVPTEFSLRQNYPNPFNPTTTIAYDIPSDCHVELSVYNILGERVTTLVNEFKSAGTYNIIWNGENESGSPVASGIYFYRIKAGEDIKSMKMTLMK